MSQVYDFAILSREDRGLWLSSEIRKSGRSVALVDCSENLGRWASEDLEGPFGIMRSPGLTAKQLSRTTEGISVREAEAGFVIWLKNKPIELKGSNFNYLKKIHGELKAAEDYFMDADGASVSEVQLLNEKIDLKSFADNWLIHLGHNFSANVALANASSIRPKRPFPLFYNYFHREPSRHSMSEGLNRLTSEGVEVFRGASLKDISLDSKKNIENIQIQSSHSSELVRAKIWIVLLSPEEIQFLNKDFYQNLYGEAEAVKPSWSWVRFRLKFENQEAFSVIPSQSLLISDLKLPWSHDNFIQCLKRGDSEFDFWVKIPEIERFRKEYLKNMQRSILKRFQARVPGTDLKQVYMPAEYNYSFEELGPSVYGCYDPTELARQKHKLPKNWISEGPEVQSRLDLGHRLMRQQSKLDQWINLGAESDRTLQTSGDGRAVEL